MKKTFIILGLVGTTLLFSCKENTTTSPNKAETEIENAVNEEQNEIKNDVTHTESEKTFEKDLAEVAIEAENLNTFVDAIEQAGMVVKIKGKGPFTIFAPTDEAFKKLPKGSIEELMKPENANKLEAALSYHIIPGNLNSEKLSELIKNTDDKKYELITANDGKIWASFNNENQVILTDGKGNQAMVTKADQKGKNGVIHSINSVLMRK